MDESGEGVRFPKPKLDLRHLHSASAPAVVSHKAAPLSASTAPKYGQSSYDPIWPAAPSIMREGETPPEDEFTLDEKAPARAAKHRSEDVEADSSRVKRWDAVPKRSGAASLGSVREEEEQPGDRPLSTERGKGKAVSEPRGRRRDEDLDDLQAKDEGPVWGESFKVEWIRTNRLQFYRTRNLRNPWNHDREVKVSRDGTELEPSVGQALLDEWDKPAPSPPPTQPPRSGMKSSPPDMGHPG